MASWMSPDEEARLDAKLAELALRPNRARPAKRRVTHMDRLFHASRADAQMMREIAIAGRR